MSLNGNVINAFNNANLIRSLDQDEFDLYLEVIRLITEVREYNGYAFHEYFEFRLSVGIDINEFITIIREIGINCSLPSDNSITIFPN